MSKDGYSRDGFAGTTNHYHASGKKVAYSHDRPFGEQYHHKKK